MKINYEALGRKIKEVRRKQNMTQEYLAEKVDLSISHISNIETAKTKVSLPTLVEISNALGVSVDYLLMDSYKSLEMREDIFVKELDTVIENCGPRDKKIVLEISKKLAELLESE
ncbi:helix-turn-helix domain-containing protein [Anaerostipes sp.]|uniref:helix-turn-helix domain-containing protein n=1 Tax=Anaerostipes sp. TaxID=1872530 RepID=UPI0025BB2249|nr:helix-turn-helix transcriptional regulator [Anaerostipes sp.]MBS7007791.1 helix-turn-helix transcriptional regulator [Anaerostipes sp.]